MKIFESEQNSHNEKTNFVDENNVMLGFDRGQCCCERANWYVSDNEKPTAKEINTTPQDLTEIDTWRFDPFYYVKYDEIVLDEVNSYNPLGSGAVATFRLVNTQGQQKFLHLFNCHNGYYSHGFKFEGATTLEDYL